MIELTVFFAAWALAATILLIQETRRDTEIRAEDIEVEQIDADIDPDQLDWDDAVPYEVTVERYD